MDDRTTQIVLFGMHCAFTAPILAALAASPQVEILAVILPVSQQGVGAEDADSVAGIVRSFDLPIIEVQARTDLTSGALRESLTHLAPDLIVTACFPWRLPHWMLTLPRRGCVNVHPSLLPVGRGPEPIFWAFRWELETTGVSLHLMVEALDTGPILAQRHLEIPADATMLTLEQSLARIGANMLLEYVSHTPYQAPHLTHQDEAQARYGRFPMSEDLVVPTSWNASASARFIQAVLPVYQEIPILVLATGQRIAISRLRSVHEDDSLREPIKFSGNTVTIRFADGVLEFDLRSSSQPLQLHRAVI